MKKSLLATAILGLATATCANAALTTSGTPITGVSPDAQSGFPTDIPVMPYAQIDLGATTLMQNGDDDLDVSNKTVFSQRVTVGFDFQGDRLGLDFTNFGHYKWHDSLYDANAELKADIYGIGLSYSHAFMLNSTIRPYIGARIGYTHFKSKLTVSYMSKEIARVDNSDNHASIGAFAGVEFDATRNITFGIGTEYNQLWGNDTTDIAGKAFMRVYF
ncbi:opacity family porin [Actinobacillus delphinicola]|uniref:Porin opacity type n=1 Tax=Actinobacillus delphinicola TaxID=51161 RepID=A0A448TVK6_9PAST|nr:opacity family porin [Actinobacillus delphinicola]VEJ09965.1 porin opacity type [Actinobacillus delphinicola]